MKLVSITPARNEAWVLRASLPAMLAWVDEAVVLDHASDDETSEIICQAKADYPGRVTHLYSGDPIWREMSHRQGLLETARKQKATHIATIDADEILTGDWLPKIRDRITELQPGRFHGITMRNLHRGLGQFRSDAGIWGKQAGTMLAFADSPELCWQTTDGYDHHHRHPHGSRYARKLDQGGGLMHLQFASWRRLTAKHEWYKMTERVRWPGKSVAEVDRLYSLALDETGAEVEAVPEAWWAPYDNLRELVDLEATPWHEAACDQMLREYGPQHFNGLNIPGVLDRAGLEVAA